MKLPSFIDLKKCERPWDAWLLLIVCALMAFGVVMVYSASAVTALWDFNDEYFFLSRQLRFVGVGLIALLIGLKVDYRNYKRFAYPILIITILLLIAVAVGGTVVNNARRWIRIGGFNIQPSEIAKITAVFFLAYSMSKKKTKMKSVMIGIVPHLILLFMLAGLLMLEPDLGSCLLLTGLTGCMLLYAGSNWLFLIGGVGIMGVLGWLVIANSNRMARIEAFLNPWEHAQDSAYQITQGFVSLGNGGMTGTGLGDGLGKLGFIPELHTDCISAIIGEEFGFIGITAIIILFIALAIRGYLIALRANDDFGRLTAFGITTVLVMQASINLAVVAGMIPSKGFTLPFVSYGGSSLIMCLFAIGVLLNISQGKEDPYEKILEAKEKRRIEEKIQRRRERLMNKNLKRS